MKTLSNPIAPQNLILALSICVVALTGCSSDKTIGATAERQYTGNPVGCPKASAEGRGTLAVTPGVSKIATNLCFEAQEASFEGKPAKIIWGTTAPLGPAAGELTKTDKGLSLIIGKGGINTQGRTGTQMTLQQGSKRIAVNFTVNALDTVAVASSAVDTATNFNGSVTVPPLRGLNYLDSRGRGNDVGYEEPTAFYASGGQYAKDSTKKSQGRPLETGKIQLLVKTINPETGEISGEFVSEQPTGASTEVGEVEIKGRFLGTFK